jgi:hypothetical protein
VTPASRSGYDAVLVRLWNEIEPARISGDKGTLRQIERAARRIEQDGDEAQRREAARLLDELRELQEQEETRAPATERLDAEVAMGERTFRDAPRADESDREAQETPFDEVEDEEERRGLRRLMPLLWILVFVVVLILNLLGSRE